MGAGTVQWPYACICMHAWRVVKTPSAGWPQLCVDEKTPTKTHKTPEATEKPKKHETSRNRTNSVKPSSGNAVDDEAAQCYAVQANLAPSISKPNRAQALRQSRHVRGCTKSKRVRQASQR